MYVLFEDKKKVHDTPVYRGYYRSLHKDGFLQLDISRAGRPCNVNTAHQTDVDKDFRTTQVSISQATQFSRKPSFVKFQLPGEIWHDPLPVTLKACFTVFQQNPM